MATAKATFLITAEDGATRALRSIDNSMQGLGRAARRLDGLLKGVTAAFGVGHLVQVNREFESMRVSLQTVTGSAELAGQAFGAIQQFAADTPYSVQEVTSAFTKLVALGLKPTEEAMVSYGNTASAMGKSLDQMIEAVADASVGEFERLKEFGIKASSEGDKVAFTFRGVSTTVQKESSAIEEYLVRLGQTEFAGGMERQANTMDGALSNLGDSWDRLMDNLLDEHGGRGVQKIIRGISSAVDTVSDGVDEFRVGFIAAMVAIEQQASDFKFAFQVVWESIKAAGQGAINSITEAWAAKLDHLAGVVGVFSEDAERAMREYADSYRPAVQASDELAAKIAELNDKRLHEQEIAQRALDAAVADVNARREQGASLDAVAQALDVATGSLDRNTTSQKENNDAKKIGIRLQKEQEQLLAEGRRLTEALRTADEKLGESHTHYLGLLEAGAISQETYHRAMMQAQEEYDRAMQDSNNTLRESTDLWGNFGNSVINALDGAIFSGNSLSDVLKRLGQDLLQIISNSGGISSLFGGGGSSGGGFSFGGIFDWVGSLFGGGSSSSYSSGWGLSSTAGFFDMFSGLGFAAGGRPPLGKISLVGERGPELFVPDSAGTIVPNHALGGGGGDVYINIENRSGGEVETRETRGPSGERQIDIIVGTVLKRMTVNGELDNILKPYNTSRRGVAR